MSGALFALLRMNYEFELDSAKTAQPRALRAMAAPSKFNQSV
jgi:hypothetical protein